MYKPEETPRLEWQSGRVIAKAWEASERLRVAVDFQQGIRAVELASWHRERSSVSNNSWQ